MDIPDEELVRRARAGRREAFEELVRRHHAAVIRLCAAALADPSRAEDAAQEVFLKAWLALGAFAGGSSFSTWLHRIAVNRCLDLLRADARRRVDSLDAIVEREGERAERLLSSERDPSAALADRDLADRLLAALPDDYRVALVLRETQGLSYEEVAEAMGCTVEAVRARLRRAREALVEAARHFSGTRDV